MCRRRWSTSPNGSATDSQYSGRRDSHLPLDRRRDALSSRVQGPGRRRHAASAAPKPKAKSQAGRSRRSKLRRRSRRQNRRRKPDNHQTQIALPSSAVHPRQTRVRNNLARPCRPPQRAVAAAHSLLVSHAARRQGRPPRARRRRHPLDRRTQSRHRVRLAENSARRSRPLHRPPRMRAAAGPRERDRPRPRLEARRPAPTAAATRTLGTGTPEPEPRNRNSSEPELSEPEPLELEPLELEPLELEPLPLRPSSS